MKNLKLRYRNRYIASRVRINAFPEIRHNSAAIFPSVAHAVTPRFTIWLVASQASSRILGWDE